MTKIQQAQKVAGLSASVQYGTLAPNSRNVSVLMQMSERMQMSELAHKSVESLFGKKQFSHFACHSFDHIWQEKNR
jgi:hypothetical protein